jgi:hypothetical protein
VATLALDTNNLSDYEKGFNQLLTKLGIQYEVIGVNQIKDGSINLGDYRVVIANFGPGYNRIHNTLNDAVVIERIKTSTTGGTNWILFGPAIYLTQIWNLTEIKCEYWYPYLNDSCFAVEKLVDSPILEGVEVFPDYHKKRCGLFKQRRPSGFNMESKKRYI